MRHTTNNLSQIEFFVVGVLSIMAIENINVMVSKENFEGLLTYYVKMNVGQFVKQWMTPKLYHKLLEQTQTT
jgi:hypothetical protein